MGDVGTTLISGLASLPPSRWVSKIVGLMLPWHLIEESADMQNAQWDRPCHHAFWLASNGCAVLCCAVLCCAVLCCAVTCCAVL